MRAHELVPDVLFIMALNPREVGWKDDPNGPRRQRRQQASVVLKKPVKIIEWATQNDVNEDPASGQIDADRHPLARGTDGPRTTSASRQACSFIGPDFTQRRQVNLSFVLRRQPHNRGAGEQSIEQDQVVDDASCRQWSAMPAIGLTNRPVERLALLAPATGACSKSHNTVHSYTETS